MFEDEDEEKKKKKRKGAGGGGGGGGSAGDSYYAFVNPTPTQPSIFGRVLRSVTGYGQPSAGGNGGRGGIGGFFRSLFGFGGGRGQFSPETVSDYPSGEFNYDVYYFADGDPVNNATLDRATAMEAAKMQSLEEHNRAVNKYVSMLPKNATPEQFRAAVEQGKREEEQLLSFWKDNRPRRNFSPGSSAVSGVRINGDNTISVRFNPSGKWYTYRGGPNRYEASLAAKDLLTAPSIGQAIGKNGWWSAGRRI